MPVVGLGNLIRITLRGRLYSQQIRNVLHFETVSGSGAPTNDLDQFQSAFNASVRDAFLEACPSGYFLVDTIAEELTYAFAALPSKVAIVQNDLDVQDLPGTGAPSTEAPQLSNVLILRTGGPGSSRRGRIFLPGIVGNGQSNGEITPAGRDSTNDLRLALADPLSAGPPATPTEWELCVFSRLMASQGPAVARLDDFSFVVTQITQSPVVGTKGSRRLGRGA